MSISPDQTELFNTRHNAYELARHASNMLITIGREPNTIAQTIATIFRESAGYDMRAGTLQPNSPIPAQLMWTMAAVRNYTIFGRQEEFSEVAIASEVGGYANNWAKRMQNLRGFSLLTNHIKGNPAFFQGSVTDTLTLAGSSLHGASTAFGLIGPGDKLEDRRRFFGAAVATAVLAKMCDTSYFVPNDNIGEENRGKWDLLAVNAVKRGLLTGIFGLEYSEYALLPKHVMQNIDQIFTYVHFLVSASFFNNGKDEFKRFGLVANKENIEKFFQG